MLARMNFAAQLATNQKFNLRDRRAAGGQDAGGAAVVRARSADAARRSRRRRTTRCSTTRAPAIAWTGSDAQLATKASGLVHLIVGRASGRLLSSVYEPRRATGTDMAITQT